MKMANIGGLLKRIYRSYNAQLLSKVQDKGFTDLRSSYLEVLLNICEKNGPSIKHIGQALGLKKQTMTSHLNELEKRGYIIRSLNPKDKREVRIYLTDFGERFKLALLEAVAEIEESYRIAIGDVELDRVEHILANLHQKMPLEGMFL